MPGPLPLAPTNFLVQTGNGQVYLSWQPATGATSYNVLKSTDQINWALYGSTTASSYYDNSPTTGAVNYYRIQSTSASTTGFSTSPFGITPLGPGQECLGSIRLQSQMRADKVNSHFLSTWEWNQNINKSYKELYDLLVATFTDEYFVANPYQFTSDGRNPALYPLPSDFYKMLGEDLSIGANSTGWLTLKKFSFISRNRYIFGNTPVSFLGVLNLRYRVMGSNIMFIPPPAANQTIQLWYIPKPKVLLADSDLLDGVSGWEEYVIVDAAIKGMQKEESDVRVLLAQKAALKARIEGMAPSRDAGEAETVSDTRRLDGSYSLDPFGDNPSGGF